MSIDPHRVELLRHRSMKTVISRIRLCFVGVIVLTLSGCARRADPASQWMILPHSSADDVAPACPPPPVDTTGWRRVRATVIPVSFLLPPDWSQVSCRKSDPGLELWCGPHEGDEIAVNVGGAPTRPTANAGSSHPTLHFSSCEESIGGQTVWVAAGIRTGYTHIAAAWASWRLPAGNYVHVTVEGERRAAHERALMILRTVRLLGSWKSALGRLERFSIRLVASRTGGIAARRTAERRGALRRRGR